MNPKIQKYLQNKHFRSLVDVGIFAVIIVVFHVLWKYLGLHSLLVNRFSFQELESAMARLVFDQSAWFINHFTSVENNILNQTMYFSNQYSVTVNNSCSGLKQIYQWVVLILVFPGPWKHKLWYIPMGMLVTHLVNVFRIIVLDIIMSIDPSVWEFTHDMILRPFFYVVIFIMWMVWEEKFRLPSLKSKQASETPATH